MGETQAAAAFQRAGFISSIEERAKSLGLLFPLIVIG